MLVRQIEERVRSIREAAGDGDHETAHEQEDKLLKDVLLYIAQNGAPRAKGTLLARAALESTRIDFKRCTA